MIGGWFLFGIFGAIVSAFYLAEPRRRYERWPILQSVRKPVIETRVAKGRPRRSSTAFAVFLSTCFLMSEPPLLSEHSQLPLKDRARPGSSAMVWLIARVEGCATITAEVTLGSAELYLPISVHAQRRGSQFPDTSMTGLLVGPQRGFRPGVHVLPMDQHTGTTLWLVRHGESTGNARRHRARA